MGSARPHTPEKLVVAVLLAEAEPLEPVLAAVETELGALDYTSPPLTFDFTRYYETEMGRGLRRLFLSARDLVDPEDLPRFKVRTNRIESRFSTSGRRRVNLDPGLLSSSRFILASTKDSSHRIPLGDGMFAEITLVYEHGQFRPVEWTYPDYACSAYREILKDIRSSYLHDLRRHA